jgi:hypothetical protein
MQTSVAARCAGVSVVIAVASIVGLAGCFETETTLAPVEQATVDVKLVGDWKTTDGEGNSVLTVRNFNGREYYIEDRAADGKTVRYAGFLADVKGATFLHVRELTDDGTVAKKYVLLRLDRTGDGHVNLRQLKDEFFADKPHDTTPLLRAIIEQHLGNAAMYDGEPLQLTRTGP